MPTPRSSSPEARRAAWRPRPAAIAARARSCAGLMSLPAVAGRSATSSSTCSALSPTLAPAPASTAPPPRRFPFAEFPPRLATLDLPFPRAAAQHDARRTAHAPIHSGGPSSLGSGSAIPGRVFRKGAEGATRRRESEGAKSGGFQVYAGTTSSGGQRQRGRRHRGLDSRWLLLRRRQWRAVSLSRRASLPARHRGDSPAGRRARPATRTQERIGWHRS